MAPIANVLTGFLALGGLASAGHHHHHRADHLHDSLHKRNNFLVSVEHDGAREDGITFRSSETPNALKPIRPLKTSKAKREVNKGFEIHSRAQYFWGADGTIAQFDVDTSEDEKISGFVDYERFDDMVEKLVCPPETGNPLNDTHLPLHNSAHVRRHTHVPFDNGTSPAPHDGTNPTLPEGYSHLTMKFLERSDLDEAGDIWRVLKKKDGQPFYLVVGDNDCGWNEDREVFHIIDMDFNEDTNTAIFQAKISDWQEAARSFDLSIGKNAATNHTESAKAARGLDDIVDDVVDDVKEGWEDLKDGVDVDLHPEKPVEIDFDMDYTGKGFGLTVDGVEYKAHCVNCTTKGDFKMDALFKMRNLEMKEAWVDLSTNGIDAVAILDLYFKGKIGSSGFEKVKDLIKLSPTPVVVNRILNLGPTAKLALTAGISNDFKGAIKVQVGGTASVPKSSVHIDFLAKDKLKKNGWQVDLEGQKMKAEVLAEATAKASLAASLGVELVALETGFAFDLDFNIPELSGTLRAIHSTTCSACDENWENAMQGSVQLGTSVTLGLKKLVAGDQDDLWSVNIYDYSMDPLASFCNKVGKNDKCSKKDGPSGNSTSSAN